MKKSPLCRVGTTRHHACAFMSISWRIKIIRKPYYTYMYVWLVHMHRHPPLLYNVSSVVKKFLFKAIVFLVCTLFELNIIICFFALGTEWMFCYAQLFSQLLSQLRPLKGITDVRSMVWHFIKKRKHEDGWSVLNQCTEFYYVLQGRKWLPKTGWASSNVACRCRRAAARRRLLFCQKLGGQLPTLPTRQLHP